MKEAEDDEQEQYMKRIERALDDIKNNWQPQPDNTHGNFTATMDVLTRRVKVFHVKEHTEKYRQATKRVKEELDKAIDMPEAREAIQAMCG